MTSTPEQLWDERYRASTSLWSGQPNPQLVAEAAGLAVGQALDVGCGEGADGIWLATRGWDVLGIDVSSVALGRADEHARAVGVTDSISWQQADLLAWQPPARAFDLVSVQFLHLVPDQRRPVYAALAAAVAPGGTLLVAAHHPSDHDVVPRPPVERLVTAQELAADLAHDDWDLRVVETRGRSVTTPAGEPVTVHDAVLVAVRSAC